MRLLSNHWVAVLAAVVLLASLGCGATYALRHTVQAGDTVSSVARRYGVSEAELRRFNEMQAGDELRRGDVLFVPGAAADPTTAPAPARQAPPAAGGLVPVTPPPAVPKPAAPPSSPTPRPPAAPQAAAAPLAWPLAGDLLRGFGAGPAGDNRGIDIAATAGEAVVAAADGTVTYAGAPAAAYGTIVIVEHPGKRYTVYSKLGSATVAKGQRVSRGQTLGTVAEGKPSHLHFEVREGERAVNPLLSLPPR